MFLEIMDLADFIWNEFVYGGHWGSLNASAIALSTTIILGIQIKWGFLLIAYLVTQCIYNFNHYKEIDIDVLSNSPRVNHLKKYKSFLPFIPGIYGVFFFALLLYFGSRESSLFGGFLLTFGLLFSSGGKKISKKIVGFKSLYTSFAWGLLAIFTAIYHSYPFDIAIIILLIFIFLRLMINTSFSDIKDINSDRDEGLLTFPMIFNNRKNWLLFLHLLNIISFIPLLVGVLLEIFPSYSLFLLFTFFYSFYYIQKAKSEKADIRSLSSILADGEYYYWPFLLFLGLIFIALR